MVGTGQQKDHGPQKVASCRLYKSCTTIYYNVQKTLKKLFYDVKSLGFYLSFD